MPRVGTLFQFIGGAITRVAGTALIIGIFFVLMGVTPWQFVVQQIAQPPAWMASSWFRLVILVLGLSVIWVSFNFNRWSVRQRTIDGLAEDISWAIDNLLNRHPGIDPDAKFIDNWKSDFENWCAGVSKKLGNRAFFTRADQLHFDYLGFIDPRLNHLLSQLRVKIDRLRDVINWTQERRG